MTTKPRIEGETTEEVIRNYACMPLNRERIWNAYADALFEVEKYKKRWDGIGARMAEMELEIRDRMLESGKHLIETGPMVARLEWNTRLKNQYSVRIERDGECISSEVFTRKPVSKRGQRDE